MGLESLLLNYQLHHAVEGTVVQYWSFPAWEQVSDDAFEKGQVHLQKLREIDILSVNSKSVEIVTTTTDHVSQRVYHLKLQGLIQYLVKPNLLAR